MIELPSGTNSKYLLENTNDDNSNLAILYDKENSYLYLSGKIRNSTGYKGPYLA